MVKPVYEWMAHRTRKFILPALLFAAGCVGAQNTQVKYYKTPALDKEIGPENAKFSKTIIQNPDGSETIETRDLKKKKLTRSETYKDDEPFGVWVYDTNVDHVITDYNFTLRHSEEVCKTPIADPGVKDCLLDEPAAQYVAPRVASGESSVYQFVNQHLEFPVKAKEESMEGTVILVLNVSKEGRIEDLYVQKGVNPLLDKEAARVLRQVKFSSPASLKGQAVKICVSVPVTFNLN